MDGEDQCTVWGVCVCMFMCLQMKYDELKREVKEMQDQEKDQKRERGGGVRTVNALEENQ